MDRNRNFKIQAFQADSWLNTNSSTRSTSGANDGLGSPLRAEHFPPLPDQDLPELFNPSDYVIPGWKGEGLLSKSALIVRKAISELVFDAQKQFESAPEFTSYVKKMIFDEYASFSQTKSQQNGNQNASSITEEEFWAHFKHSDSPSREVLDQFIEAYTFRTVVVYTNKIRFILRLSNALNQQLTPKDLLNHNNLISKIFVKGSSQELNCQSLKLNQYSWYRPSIDSKSILGQLKEHLPQLSTTELNKIFTFKDTAEEALLLEEDEQDSLNLLDRDYSHALSHKTFGMFLNQMLVNFPAWLEKDQSTERKWACYEASPAVLNTKFVGDYLGSLTLSHWLAQEQEVVNKWEQLICPDFIENKYHNGAFHKICHELQFLAFLVYVARFQKHRPLELICRIMKDKYSLAQQMKNQMPLFFSDDKEQELFYQRIVINYVHLPEKNPHHSLLKRISSEASSLLKDGHLFVFSNQKLFVPSHSDKVEQLLKTFKLEGHINFESLKGRGEVPNYLYIFTKRKMGMGDGSYLPSYHLTEKESCLSFRISGELSRFNKFEEILQELKNFFVHKSATSTPLYQMELDGGKICFEFHQDAILEGKLLSSNQKNSDSITHPNFFKNLTKSCVSFEQFFQVENLNQHSQEKTKIHPLLSSGLLGMSMTSQQRFPYVLIVNYSNPRDIRIELVGHDLYSAKLEQYGNAFYQYFGLLPKNIQMNINTFKEYFNSQLGLQILQLNLTGGAAKLKSKIKALLVPKFFEECQFMPQLMQEQLKLLQYSSKELLNTHPQDLEQQSKFLFEELNKGITNEFPWHTLGLLSHFKNQVYNALQEFSKDATSEDKPNSYVQYSNPMIIEELVKLESFNIYSNNQDVFLDFTTPDPRKLNLPLSSVSFKSDAKNGDYLELQSQGETLLKIYTDAEMLQFIRFILNSASGTPILDIVKQLSIPKISDFMRVLKNFNQVEDALTKSYELSEKFIEQILNRQITRR